MPRILGIDPGSRLTGFGIIEVNLSKAVYVTCGCIRMRTTGLPTRLQEIYAGLNELITQYQPTILAIEKVFMHRNVASALTLGHARGVAMVVCIQHGLSINEYAPTQIKQAVVGHGHAAKVQVQQMVKVLLSLPQVPSTDAADALAVALCHARFKS